MACCGCVCLALAAGCVAHESVGRPPTLAEIARINDSVAPDAILAVDYIEPAPPSGGAAVGNGDSAAQPGDRPVGIERIVSADAQKLTVDIGGGATRQIDLSLVAGVSVPDGTHDALAYGVAGGAIGLGVGVLELGGLYLLATLLQSSDTGGPQSSGSYGPAIGIVVTSAVVGAAIGALFGAQHGGRRSFDFGGSAEPIGD